MDTGISEWCSQEIELNAGILMSNFYSPKVSKLCYRRLLTKLGKSYKGRESAGNQRFYTRKEEINKGWPYGAGSALHHKPKGWELLPRVSDHVGKMRELGKEEWGDYMAGLIDGNGRIGEGVIEVRLREGEYSLAYKLKKEVGYGVVRELKEEEGGGLMYKVEKEGGRERISKAINGRMRTEKKVEELRRSVGWEVRSRREDGDMNNYWLAGLMDSRGKLEIGLKGDVREVELRLEISLRGEEGLLRKVRDYLKGGSVLKNEKGEIGIYRNTKMEGVYKVIGYLDKYKMRSRRYVSYLKYRKVYRIVTRGEHITERGMKKIESIRSKGIIRD